MSPFDQRIKGVVAAPTAGGLAGVAARLGLMLSLLLAGVDSIAAELRPIISAGYGDIVDGHASISAALRVQIASAVFVQAEYIALKGDRHTDHGPTLLVGLSLRNRAGFRPFVGLGGGPVKGYQGDDGMLYLAVGASQALGRNRGAFLQAELRAGLLGESAYRQLTLGIGISR